MKVLTFKYGLTKLYKPEPILPLSPFSVPFQDFIINEFDVSKVKKIEPFILLKDAIYKYSASFYHSIYKTGRKNNKGVKLWIMKL